MLDKLDLSEKYILLLEKFDKLAIISKDLIKITVYISHVNVV